MAYFPMMPNASAPSKWRRFAEEAQANGQEMTNLGHYSPSDPRRSASNEDRKSKL
jgi:hypothetical protein